jgi:hypothetical protein
MGAAFVESLYAAGGLPLIVCSFGHRCLRSEKFGQKKARFRRSIESGRTEEFTFEVGSVTSRMGWTSEGLLASLGCKSKRRAAGFDLSRIF